MREAEKKRLVKLIEEAGEGYESRSVVDIVDYLLDNGVIVPPCKVGDEVYCIVFLPVEGRLEIGMGSVISMEIRHEKLNIRIADCELTRYANLDITVDSRDFGKTVFFSEAEAEYALKNRRSVSLVNGHIEE